VSHSSDNKLVPPAELIETLRSRDNFLIATHINPDGDAIGSSVALAMALEQIGKKVALLDKHTIPHQYFFMPGHDRFYTYETLQAAGLSSSDFDTLVLLDCNSPERIGMEDKEQHPAIEEMKSAVAKGMFTIVVDHHATEKGFGKVKWITAKAAATGLMVYAIIRTMGLSITKEIAHNLYTAMVIDTGNFRFDNTDAGVFRVAAELIDYGASPSRIYEDVYESFSGDRFRLYLKVIGTLEINGCVAMQTVTKKMLEETSTVADDTENFVSFPRLMSDIKVSVLVRELCPDECKVSLRSKGDINVGKVAEHFNGGGHRNAAGCRIKSDINPAKRLVFDKIKELYFC
jgi:phosphoesterase RecJ-like protein